VSLVPVTPGVCPDCGDELSTGSWDQPALVRHGGHGGTRRTVVRWCPNCTWTLVAEVGEAR
jgi:hypothetical protein